MTTVDMSSYLVAPLQLDRICRACLMEKGDMRPLFGACLDEMLQSFTGIEIAENDGLPYHMCVQCVLQCSRAYTFKQLCEKSDGILKQYISKDFQDALKEYQDQETCKNKVKKELEEQLNFKTGAAPLEDQSNNITEEASIYESIINSQESDLQKSDIEDFYPAIETVDCGPDLSNDDSMYNNSNDEDLRFKINLTNFSELSSDEPETARKPGKYRCNKCDMDFGLKVDLKVHVLSHPQSSQGFEYSCDICHKRFAQERVLRRHKKIHLQRKPHQCDQCDMTFAESSNLSKHKKKHTGELRNIKGKPHLCSVCGKSFKWASSLHKHSKYHTGHKLLSCTYCPKQYVEARSLKIHLRAHTGERPYSCDICDRTFTQSCNLDKHRRVHTGEKPYLCPICNKGFSQSGYIAIHMRTHTGDRPYVCQTCGKAFSGSSSLTLHERIHTGEKPYTCKICNKSFSRHETLSNHVRSHTGDKPHVCTVCNKRFTSSAQLSGHMKTHNGEKTHSCEICDKKFSGAGSLKIHMKSHQQDLVEQVEEEVVQEILPVMEYTCKLCDETLKDEAAVNTHILDVHAIQIKDDLEGIDAMEVTEIVVG